VNRLLAAQREAHDGEVIDARSLEEAVSQLVVEDVDKHPGRCCCYFS
jgi:hypothetical protein